MALTSAQLATLHTDILANPALNSQPLTPDGSFAIAAFYNTVASPAFRVWRTLISAREVKLGVVWTEFIARSQGERDGFQFMLSNGSINGADANIRQGIADVFSGASGVQSRTNLLALAKRDATNAEKLFAVGTGTDASPATMAFEGSVSTADVSTARGLP